MQEDVTRCYIFARGGWISILNPTDLNYIDNLWAHVTTKSRIKPVSLQLYSGVRKYQNMGPLNSYLCTIFHCVVFILKLHRMRPKKSRFKQRRLAILKAQRKLFELSPCWPSVVWCSPYQSRLLITERRKFWLDERKLKAASQDQKWGKEWMPT